MKLFDKIFGRAQTEQCPTVQISVEQRHKYEYEVFPSAAAYAPDFLFEQDRLVKVVFDKTDKPARRFVGDIMITRYDAGKVCISVLEFPKPQSNGELLFAATIMHEDIMCDDSEDSSGLCPYYFLALSQEGYVAGEVLTGTDDYPVVYYDQLSDVTLCGFLKWTLQKYGLDVAVEDLRLL
jgi:hypothetical protein